MKNVGLLWRTVRHLTLRQVIYQILFRLRSRPKLRLTKTSPQGHFLASSPADKSISWQNGVFTFLNQSVRFDADVDWNYDRFGKLWTYNLTYFDFLNQPALELEVGLALIHQFIAQIESLRDGLESYPTSLRIINWIQFLSQHRVRDAVIEQHLVAQVHLLRRRLEYHLAGNHLLENAFALLVGAIYFRQAHWFNKADRLLRRQLKSQILADGGHDERSPMYHQLLLDKLLDCLLILQSESWQKDSGLILFLTDKATQMLGWLNSITFRNGDVPMVNDATFGIAPTTAKLRQKARAVLTQQPPDSVRLQESGYRMIRQGRYELLADVGPIGPDHQPGHAHADTLSFVLYVDNYPVIVDNGVSTYQVRARRAWERSTVAHNTVTFHTANSSEMWANFRVGRRAKARVLIDNQRQLTARHDGYRQWGFIHERTCFVEPDRLRIIDRLLPTQAKLKTAPSGIARFYFHPTVPVQIVGDFVRAGPLKMSFYSETKPAFCVISSTMAEGFNCLRASQCLAVTFTSSLETTLLFLE